MPHCLAWDCHPVYHTVVLSLCRDQSPAYLSRHVKSDHWSEWKYSAAANVYLFRSWDWYCNSNFFFSYRFFHIWFLFRRQGDVFIFRERDRERERCVFWNNLYYTVMLETYHMKGFGWSSMCKCCNELFVLINAIWNAINVWGYDDAFNLSGSGRLFLVPYKMLTELYHLVSD